jgi:hypothetical protein
MKLASHLADQEKSLKKVFYKIGAIQYFTRLEHEVFYKIGAIKYFTILDL